MAKISKHGGPSYTGHEMSDPDTASPRVKINRPMLGVRKSPGNNSETSTEKTSNTDDSPETKSYHHARMTGNPSKKEDQETDIVPTTDGDQKTGAKSASRKSTSRTSKTNKADDEFDEFE